MLIKLGCYFNYNTENFPVTPADNVPAGKITFIG